MCCCPLLTERTVYLISHLCLTIQVCTFTTGQSLSAYLKVYNLGSSVYITGYTRYKMTYPVKKLYLGGQVFMYGHITN